ncbi:hypothetical protein [Spirosoma luteum]|uniref:hypothetical protein n=1 Tax=Spirosoma luteum TaxID=431553 RepID=UPI0012FB2F1E|nr:hypothetical protein [Spirosoma luteum]
MENRPIELTEHELHQIAAYQGVPYHVECVDPAAGAVRVEKGIINEDTVGQMQVYNRAHCLVSVKLTLKHIRLLTEEEILTCAALVGYQPGFNYRLNRKDSVISYGSFLIDYHKPELFFFRSPAGRGLYEEPIEDSQALTAYLKKQGYYLPGSIEEILVSLVGPPVAQ